MVGSDWAASRPLPIPLPSPLPDPVSSAAAGNDGGNGNPAILDKIDEIEAENTALSRELQIQAAVLLSKPTTRAAITSLPLHDSRRKALLEATTTASLALEENAYRMLAGITAFPVRDPDPHALDRGHILGVRIDVCSDARFKTPYFVFLQRAWPKRREWVKLGRHTIPPGVAVEALAQRYLPAPKWPEGEKGPWIPECCQESSTGPKSAPEWIATLKKLDSAKRDAARRRVVELKRAAAIRRGAAFRRAMASRTGKPMAAKSNVAIRRLAPRAAEGDKSASLATPGITSQSSTGQMNVGKRRAPASGNVDMHAIQKRGRPGRSSSARTGANHSSGAGDAEGGRQKGKKHIQQGGTGSRATAGDGHICGPEAAQDLPRFLRELRRELVAYNNRLSWVADMMEAAGLEGNQNENMFLGSRGLEQIDQAPSRNDPEGRNDGISDSDDMYCYESDEESSSSEEPLDGVSRSKRRGRAEIDDDRSSVDSELQSNGSGNGSESDAHSDESDPSATDGSQDNTEDSVSNPRHQRPQKIVVQIRIMDPQVKWLRIEWADGRMGELTMNDDGVVTKLVVLEHGSLDRKTIRRLLRNRDLGKMRVERFNRHLAVMLHSDQQRQAGKRAKSDGRRGKRRRLEQDVS